MEALLAGVAGALISLAAVLLGARLNARREHQQWQRDQKLRAATEFLTTTHHLLWLYRTSGKASLDQVERRSWRNRMQLARSALYLLCQPAVVDLADQFAQRLQQTTPDADANFNKDTDELFLALREQFRLELG
ncbi:hypothetical protein AB0B66_42685 [Catellatospora sp. NPDC049111]|uniref:hypothetical protein n=1 Tax=Catellatospora sp. NPDC049111 TaxID=3155271 RepID=UPI003400A50C